MAIIAMLQRHPAKVISYIDGIGASCASVLPMISDKIVMYANSMLMVHNAWTYASGNADQLRKAADDIERINQSMVQHYLTRAGDKLDEDKLKQLLDAETWLSADEAMEYGLCDEIISANNAAACLDEKWMKEYKNVPQQLVNTQANISPNEMLERQKIAEEAKANADYINTILGGIH